MAMYVPWLWSFFTKRSARTPGGTRQERRCLPSSRLLRWGIYWGPRHGARGHRGVIAWWVRAVVPHRWGGWRHLNIGCGGDPERRRVKEYPAMEVVNVPKS